ncbi:MAG: hypothetical protein D6B28_09100 [Gammaproteobacteria bacterium]|nr:MAG: hypothetical protein D6B28_09100 [Gammaproteobacteria bacterium]
MLNQSKDKLAPIPMAERGETLEIKLSMAKMERLSELVIDAAGEVAAKLEFGIDSEGIKFISGSATAELTVECQRCMQPMNVSVEVEFKLGMVVDEDLAQELSEDYEPLVVSEETISLSALIEDELILALPIVSMHEDTNCSPYVSEYLADDSDKESESEEDRVFPFAQLGEMLKKKQ